MRSIPLQLHATAPATPLARHTARSRPVWRPGRLLSAPHRLAFAAGTLMLMLSALWWAVTLAGRALGWAAPAGLPSTAVHMLLMGFGFMPLFFAGFLFTAGPKWLGLPAVPARALRFGLQAQVAGWAVLLLASTAHDAALAHPLGGLGVAAAAVGWGALVWQFGRLLWRSHAADKLHAGLIAAAGALGAVLMALSAGALAAGDIGLLRQCVLVGLWGFIGVTYAAVAHRMLPFFSASALPLLDAWRPTWLLWVFVAVLGFEGVAVAWPPPLALQASVEAAAGLLWLGLAVRWGLVQSLRIRLLAMLHLGFVWLGVAMLLLAVSHTTTAAGEGSLGLAPLHAYTMGFLGSMLVAMATRVSAGHSGRALAVDTVAWVLFGLLQAAVIARIMSDLAGTPGPWLAAALWAAALLPWGWRHLGWYGRPRADGRPG